MELTKAPLNRVPQNQKLPMANAFYNHPDFPHTYANIPKASHFYFPISVSQYAVFESTCSANSVFKQEGKKYWYPHKTVNRKPKASFSAIFWPMLEMAPSITAVHVQLVFMSVKPSSIKRVKQRVREQDE